MLEEYYPAKSIYGSAESYPGQFSVVEPLALRGLRLLYEHGTPPPDLDVYVAAPVLALGLGAMKQPDMQFVGSFGEVVDRIGAPEHGVSHTDLTLSTARFVRALVDAKIENPNQTIGFDDMLAAADFTLGILSGKISWKQMYDFLDEHRTCALPSDTPVEQKSDGVTYVSTTADKINDAAVRLNAEVGDDDVLFLSLCHGGLLAGAGTYLTREHNRPEGNSMFYPVRYSRYKHNDARPNLSDEEKLRLAQHAAGRRVVVFDEDMCSGKTVRQAQEFFGDILGCPISSLTTNDKRRDFLGFKNSQSFTDDYLLHEQFKQKFIIPEEEILNFTTQKNTYNAQFADPDSKTSYMEQKTPLEVSYILNNKTNSVM